MDRGTAQQETTESREEKTEGQEHSLIVSKTEGQGKDRGTGTLSHR